jgi:nucleoside-diphosphate-sugar epimerase
MWISLVLHAAYQGNAVQIHGDGNQRRDFTYVGDVVAATIRAATLSARARVLNVGGGQSSSLLEVVEYASRISGRRIDIAHDGLADGDVVSTQADVSMARALLGFTPSTDLLTGMSRQWSWLVSSLDLRETHESLASMGGF